jgi:hypothetical protein
MGRAHLKRVKLGNEHYDDRDGRSSEEVKRESANRRQISPVAPSDRLSTVKLEQVCPLSRVWSIGSSMADSMLTNTRVPPSGAVGFEDPLFKRAESSTPTYTIAFSCEVLPPPENGQLPGRDDA